MATVTLPTAFPNGTAVDVYPDQAGPIPPRSGSPVVSATVAGGTLTLPGLTTGSAYVAYAPSLDRLQHFEADAGVPSVGVELGSAQITANPANTTTTAFVAVAGLTVPVLTGLRPVRIEAFLPVINGNATLGLIVVGIFRDGTQIAADTVTLPAGAQFIGWSAHPIARDNPAPGAHTYDVRAKVGSAGQVASGQASAAAPALIQVVEV